jgi:biopolymer transport protein ExbD
MRAGSSLLTGIHPAPLVGVALTLLLLGLAVSPTETTQTPVEVPRIVSCGSGGGRVLRVRVEADMTTVVTYGDQRQVVPVVDLARTVRPQLRAMRAEPIVYIDFADEVPWQEVVSVMDTLREIESCDDATPLVALETWRD